MPPSSAKKTAVSLKTFCSHYLSYAEEKQSHSPPGDLLRDILCRLADRPPPYLHRHLEWSCTSSVPCPKYKGLEEQQIAEIAFQPCMGYSWSHVCTENQYWLWFVHPQTIVWLDPKPAPLLPGHKCVPAPSSQCALETHSSTWRANPRAEVIPKNTNPSPLSPTPTAALAALGPTYTLAH